MSSPAGGHGTPNWEASMAQDTSRAASNDGESAGVAVKPMRLKVLYTFDDQNKTNCLARWPQVLQIQTVAMDETTTIGVIELKTCIQAIVQCSPELVAKLGQDYTVYAYDYSEYDNPLVGQGMLSWALAAASPTPDASTHQSRQLITGRVCKNIQGVFSNGVAETLEVKLRLVQVPTILQSEYVSSMEKYRELSKAIPAGFDHNEWFSFLQSNPSIAQMAGKIGGPAPSTSNQRNGVTMEVVNQLLSPSLQQSSTPDPFSNSTNIADAAGESRPSTPADGRKTAAKPSRPSSRASVKRPRKPRTKSMATGGNTSGYEEGTDGDEGPTTKKRAKITKTDWNSKSAFGSASDSLRVAASTAGSLRMFRPIAVAPGAGGTAASHLQEMPRAPTPIPNMPSQGTSRERAVSQSVLRRDSIASQFMDTQRQYNSPYAQDECNQETQDQIRMTIESAMTSPERNDSPADTPPDIGSSPPVMRTGNFTQSSPPIPSSPVLPQMPRTDSGFMSGNVSDLFEDEDDLRPVDDEDIAVAAKYSRRRVYRAAPPRPEVHHGFAIEEVTPGPPELLPTRMLLTDGVKSKPHPRPDQKPKGSRNSAIHASNVLSDDGQGVNLPTARNAMDFQSALVPGSAQVNHPPIIHNGPPPSLEKSQTHAVGPQQNESLVSETQIAPFPRPKSGFLSRTASAGSLTLPTVTASDPVLPPTNLQRSQTWSDAPHPTTDAVVAADQPGTTGAKKKNAIRVRLEAAIEKGEMPPFCSNCGAIETPTWRRAWGQERSGDPGYHEYSDEPGKVTAIDILERDMAGKPTLYRLIKKSLLPGEDKDGFIEILLCNPCGIWMSKYKTQRPEDKWESSQPAEKRPAERKRRERQSSRSQKVQASNHGLSTSEANFQSDALGPMDYDWPTQAAEGSQHQVYSGGTDQEREDASKRQRASSVRPGNNARALTSDVASAALQRAIQSSPARWAGTRHSPIQLEDDLGSTRRLLFPSPRKEGSTDVLGEVAINTVQPATRFHSLTYTKCQASDKENCRPLPLFDGADDDLIKLFEEELTRPSRPTTPIRKSSPNKLFKTPTRQTPSHRPLTRSQSKSARLAHKIQMLPQRTPSKTPSTAARRRSPRNHQRNFESPLTATLNMLLDEPVDTHNTINESPSRHLDLGLDFANLPDLGHSTSNGTHCDALTFHLPGFDPNHDFFSTDVPMPSSPPRLFDLYEDPLAMGMHSLDNLNNAMWSDFQMDESSLHTFGAGFVVDAGGHATFEMGTMNGDSTVRIKLEALSSEEIDHQVTQPKKQLQNA